MVRLGSSRRVASAVVALVLAVGGWWISQHHDASPEHHADGSSQTAGSHGSSSDLGTVALSALPPEAAETVQLIDQGGPFPYPDQDGGRFGNYEGLLPEEPSGYYKEYTVPTPGSPDRGARRIITGADGTLYWTEDHYEHFSVISR